MKYLKHFKELYEFDTFKGSDKYILPNVSYVVANKSVSFDPYIPPRVISVGDIAYWDGNKVQTCALDQYDTSMGIAVGVVVIPGDFLPDGKARMIALNQSNTTEAWGGYGTDISDLVNYNRVPITDNAGSTTTGWEYNGYLPSDKFTGSQSFVDPMAKYDRTSILIPSPYLSDGTLNPEYMKTINSYNNVLSDFNGKGNTDILVGLGSDYVAANHAKNYTLDGVSGIDWYLPACGELGVMLARIGSINTVISTLGGVAVPTSDALWSSSEFNSDFAFCAKASNGYVGAYSKNYGNCLRPFAMID